MLDTVVICRRLAVLLKYYRELQELVEGLSLDEYLRAFPVKRAVEREIQLIVECATDINNMILRKLTKKPASDYFNSFIDLAEENVISMELALAIAPSTGLRNIIVHEYEKIDDEIVYHSISNLMVFYKKYMKVISGYLECNI